MRERSFIRRKTGRWHSIPEIHLLMLALPLELLWEAIQLPLYTIWHDSDWGDILFALVHCTLGDLMILMVVFWMVALLNRNRNWHVNSILPNGLLFTALGLAYTVYSEIVNIGVKGTWEYTEQMPIVPVVEIGAAPFLQWLLIPPLLLWLMRRLAG